MSFIPYQDPHPGRCKNYRSVHHIDSHVENLRCLDYEGVPHQCFFPTAQHVVRYGSGLQTSYTQTKPKPWVKPTNASGEQDG